MCGIVDANVANEVFGNERPSAGEHFFGWLMSPRGQLVVGGKLLQELDRSTGFRRWMKTAIGYGRARTVSDDDIEARGADLRQKDICRSDDEHVLALALVSGARLLYTNDEALTEDFKNREIVGNPRGKIYTTVREGKVTVAHKRLLADRTLCRAA